jgi:hypothetical protein
MDQHIFHHNKYAKNAYRDVINVMAKHKIVWLVHQNILTPQMYV